MTILSNEFLRHMANEHPAYTNPTPAALADLAKRFLELQRTAYVLAMELAQSGAKLDDEAHAHMGAALALGKDRAIMFDHPLKEKA